jgi:hypothetical protein
MKNWEDIATTSEHHAVVEIKKSFQDGNLIDVEEGLETLLDVMARAEKRAVHSQLVRLMHHIIKWKIQPSKRSRSWAVSINDARNEIEDEKTYSPSLNDDFILSIWDECFRRAKKDAEFITQRKAKNIEELTWKEVFEDDFYLENH